MAVKPAHERSYHCRTVTLPNELDAELRRRSKLLGYPTVSDYVRCILSREFREPRIPKSRILLGRAPRKMALHRPKH